jgi:localization factor PodJL
MSGAQSWSVKGIDPKVREAAREAAARQGMSLGEYLSQALQTHHGGPQAPAGAGAPAPTRPRRVFGASAFEENGEDDWSISGPTTLARGADPSRLAQRIETIERRTQLAVTGLDRAVSTIDRSVLGLAARIEDAEAISNEASERMAEAIEQFRIAGETLSGRLSQAEQEAQANRDALMGAKSELSEAKQRLESQVTLADEVARRAEAAAAFLSTEIETRDAALSQTLAEARNVAEEAARQAAAASSDAVAELRRLQDEMSERLAETENSTRRAVQSAIEEVKTDAAKGAREVLLSEVSRLESEIAKRLGGAGDLKAEQEALIARIERAEASSREATAGLRQAAGAAIADLRNTQLTLAARLKQVEETAGGGASVDLSEVRQQQRDIAERLAALETRAEHASPVTDALDAFEKRLAEIEAGGAVKTLDDSLQRLADRLAETESTANTAIRTLEETVSSIGARLESANAVQETEALRAMLESRLDAMATSVHEMVGQAREELTGQVQAALAGAQDEGLEGALADVNRRLAAAERRQAQTIEAISLEIKRMSETVDKRLRTVESRNDDAAAAAVREELSRMSSTLEQRFDEIERREAAAFDRMGLEVGRLSERLEERVGAVENRSAQAIEHVGEQVARMAERFNHRHETLARELSERMIDSEERAGARVSEAIGSIMQRLAEVEEHSAEAIAPVQKAVSSVASKLEQFESAKAGVDPHDFIPTQARRADDFSSFHEPEPYVAPMEAAQPLRAAPLPPRSFEPPAPPAQDSDLDIYFADESDELELTGSGDANAFAPPQNDQFAGDELMIDDVDLEDDFSVTPQKGEDPFWTPQDDASRTGAADADEATLDAAVFDVSPGAEPPIAPAEPPPPPGKNDYLAAARKAALAQASAPVKGQEARTPTYSLRGKSRVVLWGATGVMALMLAGGYWYYNKQQDAASSPQTAPEPQHTLPTADETMPFEAPPADPFAEAPVEDGAVAPLSETPVARQRRGRAARGAQRFARASGAVRQSGRAVRIVAAISGLKSHARRRGLAARGGRSRPGDGAVPDGQAL